MVKKLLVVVALAMTPWGEWVVAVPAGLLLSLPFYLVVIAAFTGNLLPVLFITLLWGELGKKLRNWQEKRQGKAQKFLKRYGILGLIFFAPMSVGVYISTITALWAGFSPRRTIFLHACTLVFWGVAILVLYLLGIEAWEFFNFS